MADLTRLYDFAQGQPIRDSEVDAELNQLVQRANAPEVVLPTGSFSVYRNQAHSYGAAATKLLYDSEEWDASAWFDLPNARYFPPRAGIFRLSAFQRVSGLVASYLFLYVYKNNSLHRVLGGSPPGTGGGYAASAGGSALVQANGTTDYFEVWAQHAEGSLMAFSTGVAYSYFQGEMVGKL